MSTRYRSGFRVCGAPESWQRCVRAADAIPAVGTARSRRALSPKSTLYSGRRRCIASSRIPSVLMTRAADTVSEARCGPCSASEGQVTVDARGVPRRSGTPSSTVGHDSVGHGHIFLELNSGTLGPGAGASSAYANPRFGSIIGSGALSLKTLAEQHQEELATCPGWLVSVISPSQPARAASACRAHEWPAHVGSFTRRTKRPRHHLVQHSHGWHREGHHGANFEAYSPAAT